MPDYILLIPIVIILIIVIVLAIYLIKNSKNKEQSASILDVNEVGVPSSSEFSYGYEKEATIVMDPVNSEQQETKTEETSKEEPEEEKEEVKEETKLESKEQFPDVSEEDILDITTTIKTDKESEE